MGWVLGRVLLIIRLWDNEDGIRFYEEPTVGKANGICSFEKFS